ncbi:unnamed protein product [Allacma fusca]|uniref:Phosphatidylethanolamine-binding protein n=1 Tax=Allacma fusca TaxID=39272 RepID=A0A8J2Q5C1_9HEXA|nr:unnamed protein product [Allacma fusca]
MEKHQIVPDVVDTVPKSVLTVRFGEKELNLGNYLTIEDVSEKPTLVSWNADESKLYTLCFTDPDAPSRVEPTVREWQHWYTFMVYEQPGKIDVSGEPRLNLSVEHRALRRNFSIRNFAKKQGLGEPLSGNFFQTKWDEYVHVVRAKLGLPK